jgi:O-antigen/teichoic acid export membrane protein
VVTGEVKPARSVSPAIESRPTGDPAGSAHDARTVIGNALANLVLGLTTAIYALSVPAVLVRLFPANKFAIWALALQISGYAAVLGLGLQDAIGRYVAFYTAKDDDAARSEFVSTAFYVLCVSAVLAMIGFTAVCAGIAHLFPQIPPDLRTIAGILVLAVGGVTALGLPFSVFNGVLVGLQRNDLVALIASTTKLLLAAVLILTAWLSRSIAWLAFWFVALSIASYLIMWRSCTDHSSFSIAKWRFNRPAFVEIARYCGTAIVWQAAMFVISGLDVAIVGRFDFPSLAFYSVCVTPVMIISGSTAALLGPLIQVGAGHSAHGRQRELTQLLMNGTRYAAIVMTFAAVVIGFFAEEILRVWLGADYAARGAPILRLLMIGHALRQLTYPYAALLIATGQQGKVLLSPVVEATVNLLVAVVAGRQFGAIGVASAVVCGSGVMLLLNLLFNLPRTHGEGVNRAALVLRSVLIPAACFLPMGLAALAGPMHLEAAPAFYFKATLLIASIATAWKFAIEDAEKTAAFEYVRNALKRTRRTV